MSLFCGFNTLFFSFTAFDLNITERGIQQGLLNPFLFIFLVGITVGISQKMILHFKLVLVTSNISCSMVKYVVRIRSQRSYFRKNPARPYRPHNVTGVISSTFTKFSEKLTSITP